MLSRLEIKSSSAHFKSQKWLEGKRPSSLAHKFPKSSNQNFETAICQPPTVIQFIHYVIKLNQKALCLCCLPIRHLKTVSQKWLRVWSWNIQGNYYYYFFSYDLTKSKECKSILVVQEHRWYFWELYSFIFQVNSRRFKKNTIVYVKIFKRVHAVKNCWKSFSNIQLMATWF